MTGKQPCCQYCCPQHFTEQFYSDHPQAYASHPPTFLVQHTTVDENADGCAGSNYHQTMLAHNATSYLAAIPPGLERCYCTGQPEDPAAAGSDVAKWCNQSMKGGPHSIGRGLPPYKGVSSFGFKNALHPVWNLSWSAEYEDHTQPYCEMHTMGWAGMVEPLAEFMRHALQSHPRRRRLARRSGARAHHAEASSTPPL
jgi:hypothetical protein